jgi:hypothetical protein
MGTTRMNTELGLVPRDWLSAPVFSPKKQTGVRQVSVNNNVWRMGIDNPLTSTPSSRIDMTHVRVLLGVLSFWKGENPLSMSISELARRASGSHGGAYFKLLRQKLGDLRDYWIAVELEDGNKRIFPALSRIELSTREIRSKKRIADQRQHKLALEDSPRVVKGASEHIGTHVQLENVTLAPEFVELLVDWTKLMHVRLDVMRNLTSDLAQALYLYIPSRAVHHSKEDPWRINLATLFEQLDLPVPTSKSVRKKILTQHKTSVLRQLNGVPVLRGFLHVSLRLNKDKTDWLFLAWVDKREGLPDLYSSDSALVEAWRNSGRDEKELVGLLRAPLPDLDDYQQELARLAKVELANAERFLRLCTNVLGKQKVVRTLAELKVEVIEGRGPNNPTGTLIWRLLNEIGTRVNGRRATGGKKNS